MTYIGIDPGADGAVAVIPSKGDPYAVPFSREAVRDTLYDARHQDGCFCMIEKVGAMPHQGVKSMFSFGENYGYLQGVLEAFRIPYQKVSPRKWKAEFSLTDDKGKSISCARALFPGVGLRKTDRCRTDSDGMAEALLIAEYARRKDGRGCF